MFRSGVALSKARSTLGRGATIDRLLAGVAIASQAVFSLLFLGPALNGFPAHDYLAYRWAVEHLVSGQPIYDPSAATTGGLGLFLYPPTFLVLILPLAVLPTLASAVVWIALLLGCTIAAVAVLPIRWRTRWLVIALSATFYPTATAIGFGQVGPILMLLAALGWRWLDRPARLGATIAIGTAIKLQPALLAGWAVLTGRRRAAVWGVVVFGLLAAVATLLVGPGSWSTQLSSLARTNDPILTANGLGPGRLLYEGGASPAIAAAVQDAHLVAVVVLTAFVAWRGTPVASYLAAVVACQLISPVIWPHYAIVLLLPVAYLLDRGRWLALLVPIALSLPLALVLPDATAFACYWLTLGALALEDFRTRGPAVVAEVA